jgi:putative aldouronate transport system permease protein
MGNVAISQIEAKPGTCYPKHPLLMKILKYKYFYLLTIPALIYYIIFAYIPMYGSVLAFKDFNYAKGILHSPWVGMKHFDRVFDDAVFWKVFANTLLISFGRIIYEFPVPIILAILMNEIGKNKLKRFYQTVFTFPHFVSWIVVSGIIFNLFSDAGVVNQAITVFGGQKVSLLTVPKIFRGLLYITDNWKEAGWGTIIYLAAIAGISPDLYEAAEIDGASRFQRMRYITWPAIRSVTGILLILQIGNIMNAGFDQILNMYNPIVYDVSDILDTYVYRRTFVTGMDFSSSTAIGLFKSAINVILLYSANYTVKKVNGEGIF